MVKRVGILGGTFDPPHIGHFIVAHQVQHALQLDEIRFMPNHIPPHKNRNFDTNVKDRLEMLTRAIHGQPCFKIEMIELEREGPSYTYDTMVLLTNKEKDVEFYFIIGADMIEYLSKWYKIDELIKMVTFIGVNRPHYHAETSYPVRLIEIPSIDVSSTMVRNMIKNKVPINYLVPDNVIQYIKKKGLYGAE